MRLLFFIAVGIGVAVGDTLAQATTNAPVEKALSFSSSAYTYIVPDSREYVQPTLTANHGWLHLEARYNYEGLETGSAWIGYNFSVGEKVSLEFTPMLGGVFGDVTGVAPGYKYTLSWWKLQLYSEGEYVFDTGQWNGFASVLLLSGRSFTGPSLTSSAVFSSACPTNKWTSLPPCSTWTQADPPLCWELVLCFEPKASCTLRLAIHLYDIGTIATIGRRTGMRVSGFSDFVAWCLWRTVYLTNGQACLKCCG
jgi:hypothetical protein